jgi:hypothetical protein
MKCQKMAEQMEMERHTKAAATCRVALIRIVSSVYSVVLNITCAWTRYPTPTQAGAAMAVNLRERHQAELSHARKRTMIGSLSR